jgi:uncharacterized protein (TIRG00374 family)
MKDKKSMLKKIVPLFLLGVAIVVALIALTGIGKIVGVMARVDVAVYSLAFVIQTLALLVLLVRWKIIASALDLRIRTGKMFPILLSSVFVNTVVPSARLGGEPLRAYTLSRLCGVPLDEGLATIAVDRALDTLPFIGITLAAFAVVLLTWHMPIYALISLAVVVMAATIVMSAFAYVCLRPRAAERLASWIVKRFGRLAKRFGRLEDLEDKTRAFAEDFGRGVLVILHKRRHIAPALLLSVIYWLQYLLRMYVVFIALGQPISFGAIGIATVVGLLLHAIPLPGALGIVEGFYALIFRTSGIPASVAVSAALLDRFVSFWYTALLSVAGVLWTGLKLRAAIGAAS